MVRSRNWKQKAEEDHYVVRVSEDSVWMMRKQEVSLIESKENGIIW